MATRILVVENEGIYVSPAYEEIWDRSVENLYDQYEEWMDSIHPDDREPAALSFTRIAETGGGEAREYRIVRPDGAVRWISDEGFAVYDESGNVYRVADETTQDVQKVTFHHDVQFDRLDPMLENTVFRIVQECLNNVKQHSQAARAEVRLVQNNDHLSIQVRDQGVGFDTTRVPEDCFGLRGIRERARLLGGQADIDSFPGKGTRISVELPATLNGEDAESMDSDSGPHTGSMAVRSCSTPLGRNPDYARK
ncbi:MAG: PAS domain-containing protein [Planctomycetes bacterium]|nr:PAS domain-containing protein [Planctomycetota bacterium]